jgi:hypothetical protein
MSIFSSQNPDTDRVSIWAIQLIPYTSVFSRKRTCGGLVAAIPSACRRPEEAQISRFHAEFRARDIIELDRERFTDEVQ